MRERFADDLKAAMKAKDECRVSTLRLILTALKDRDIAARTEGQGEEPSDAVIMDMLAKMVRQRRDAIKTYEEAARLELAEREAREIEIIESYLPKQLGGEEIEEAVRNMIAEIGASSIKDMGRTMAALKKVYAGTMDFGQASTIAKTFLSKPH